MKFEIAKITRAIRLAEYAKEYEGVEIRVWVNPPVKLLVEHDRWIEAMKNIVNRGEGAETVEQIVAGLNAAADGLAAIFSELWSQGPAESRWSVEEIRTFVAENMDGDPRLWPWLRNQTIELIREHREGIKKN
jgi:hypothetical protein